MEMSDYLLDPVTLLLGREPLLHTGYVADGPQKNCGHGEKQKPLPLPGVKPKLSWSFNPWHSHYTD